MASTDLLIQGCEVLQPDFSVLHNADIYIQDGLIKGIETSSQWAASSEGIEILDGSGKIALPGFVDAHTHAAQTLLRGSVVDELPMVWARILVPFESSLTPEDVYAGAMLFCLQNLRAGITTFADAGGPHMSAVAEAALKTGMRAVIARSTMDQGDFVPDSMKDSTSEAISKTEQLYKSYHGAGNGRIQIWFGIRQAITTTPALAEAVSHRSKELNTGVHAHLAEHLDEVAHCLTNYGLRPAEWFDRFDLLGPGFIGAHSVRLADREIELLSKRRANAVHCPTSNLRSHGFSKTPLMLARGINIGLGTDGASGTRLDLFEQMRLLKNAVQARFGIEINDPVALPTLEALRMATLGGARSVMLGDKIGTLETGKKADIVLLSLNKLHLSPTADLPKTIVLAAGPDDVEDVIVDGKLLLKGGEFLEFDEQEIRHQAGEAMLRVGKRAGLKLPSTYVG